MRIDRHHLAATASTLSFQAGDRLRRVQERALARRRQDEGYTLEYVLITAGVVALVIIVLAVVRNVVNSKLNEIK